MRQKRPGIKRRNKKKNIASDGWVSAERELTLGQIQHPISTDVQGESVLFSS